jgi:hypothetical protein
MKYILMMSGSRAGVLGYHASSKQDIEEHMAALHGINKDLTASREFVATQGLADPREARVVRGEKNRNPRVEIALRDVDNPAGSDLGMKARR